MMTQESTSITFSIRGPQWVEIVSVDPTDFSDDRSKYIEVATRGIESQWKSAGKKFKLGPIVEVKQKTTNGPTVIVNSYLCLLNSSIPTAQSLAEMLRKNYQEETGQDLKLDESGYTEVK